MADQRIQYTEKMVGAGHPTLADTLNRLALTEHNADGTHKGKAALLFAAQNTQVALTGNTNETELFSVVIPGGTLGASGMLRVTTHCTHTSSANNKTFSIKLGGAVIGTLTVTSTGTSPKFYTEICNRAAQNSQLGRYSSAFGAITVAYLRTIDTSVDQALTVTGQLANASETMALEAVSVEVLK